MTVYKIEDIVDKTITQNTTHIDGKWIPARPINYQHRSLTEKLKGAYLVFMGKADAFIWPKNQ